MQHNLAPTFSATPHGIMANHMPLNKSARQGLPSETLRYIKRAEELLATVKKEDWDSRTPHSTYDIPTIAKAKMMLALASPQPFPPPLNRQNWQELTKDASDDSDDEDDDSEDDSSSSDSGDDGNYSGGGGGHYNPDEPRIPAGQPGGGQWTTGDGTSTDAVSISADDIRSAIRDGFDNPSPLPQGTYVADNNLVTSDASSPATASTNNSQKTLADSNGGAVIDPNTGSPYPLPNGMDIAANVKAAEDYDPDATDADKALSMIYWFSHGGPQDYQRPDGYIPALFGDYVGSYRNVTNYNYGAVAAAMGYSLDETLTAAGAYNQAVGRTNADDMNVTYGIRNDAVRNITQGFQDYLNGKWTTEKK